MSEYRARTRRYLIIGVTACAVAQALCPVLSGVTPLTEGPQSLARHLRWALSVYMGEWIGFGIFMAWLFRRPHAVSSPPFWMIGLLLIISRVSWWGSPPSPSEDVWRYLWDGQQFIRDLPVFSVSPQSALESSHDVNISPLLSHIGARVGHPEIATVYPPGAQLFFGGSAWVSQLFGGGEHHALLGWRGLTLAMELLLLAALKRITTLIDAHPLGATCYLTCPLFAFESSLSAHLDIIGVTLMMWSLCFMIESRWSAAGALLGLSISVKFVPVILTLAYLVYLAISRGGVKRGARSKIERSPHKLRGQIGDKLPSMMRLSLCSLLTCAATFMVFTTELSSLGWSWPGLKTYATHWSFNGSLYPLLEWGSRLCIDALGLHEHEMLRPILKVVSAALVWSLGGGLMILGVERCRRAQGRRDALHLESADVTLRLTRNDEDKGLLLTVSFICMFTFLLLSPVVYSWYLLWMAPLSLILIATKHQNPLIWSLSWAGVCWGGFCVCTYYPRIYYLMNNTWRFSNLWLIVEYGTLLLTFVLMKRYTLTSR